MSVTGMHGANQAQDKGSTPLIYDQKENLLKLFYMKKQSKIGKMLVANWLEKTVGNKMRT